MNYTPEEKKIRERVVETLLSVGKPCLWTPEKIRELKENCAGKYYQIYDMWEDKYKHTSMGAVKVQMVNYGFRFTPKSDNHIDVKDVKFKEGK